LALVGSEIVALNGIDIAVLARVQSTAIAVNNLFLLVGVCSSRFKDRCNWGARGFIVASWNGNWEAKFA
jgi:hypothetical protein